MIKTVTIEFKSDYPNHPIKQLEKKFNVAEWKEIGEWISAVILIFPGQADIKIRW